MTEDKLTPQPGWEEYRLKGFGDLIGPFYCRRDESTGGLVSAFRALPKHANLQGIVHGGMLMSFADHIIGSYIFEALGSKPAATVSLTSDFLMAAKIGDWVEGRPEITKKGSSLVFARAVLTVAGETILSAASVWKVRVPALTGL